MDFSVPIDIVIPSELKDKHSLSATDRRKIIRYNFGDWFEVSNLDYGKDYFPICSDTRFSHYQLKKKYSGKILFKCGKAAAMFKLAWGGSK